MSDVESLLFHCGSIEWPPWPVIPQESEICLCLSRPRHGRERDRIECSSSHPHIVNKGFHVRCSHSAKHNKCFATKGLNICLIRNFLISFVLLNVPTLKHSSMWGESIIVALSKRDTHSQLQHPIKERFNYICLGWITSQHITWRSIRWC